MSFETGSEHIIHIRSASEISCLNHTSIVPASFSGLSLVRTFAASDEACNKSPTVGVSLSEHSFEQNLERFTGFWDFNKG